MACSGDHQPGRTLAVRHPLIRVFCAILGLTQPGLADADSTQVRPPPVRPNFLLIVADDLGYTDIGAFGSEISTPNLDAIARNGVRLGNFHAAPTCAPTRAMLLSGTDAHLAGVGSQENLVTENQRGRPGYEMYMTDRVVTVATLLRDAGYRTYMSGKWHLGTMPEARPAARGFERSWALLEGGGSHFDRSPISPRNTRTTYLRDDREQSLPIDFYSSDHFASSLLEFLATDEGDERPFFAYLAFTAPHWPLHAPDEDIARYAGRYADGYDTLRQHRLAKARQIGIIPPGTTTSPPPAGHRRWQDLNDGERREEARRMEVYAAMIDRMDTNIGRVIAYLERTRRLDDTVVIFMSDNGAEGHRMEDYPSFGRWLSRHYDNRLENIGRRGSFTSLGPGWAHAATAPFHVYKGWLAEGGTRASAIIAYPGFTRRGEISHDYATVMDVAPTLLELAGVDPPTTNSDGRQVQPMRGRSMAAYLRGQRAVVHTDAEATGWALFGRRALRQGRWKIRWLEAPHGPGRWQLYDMAVDYGETRDLAREHPALLRSMVDRWTRYAGEVGVIHPDRPIAY